MTLILSTNTYIESGLDPIYTLLENNPDLGIELLQTTKMKHILSNFLQ